MNKETLGKCFTSRGFYLLNFLAFKIGFFSADSFFGGCDFFGRSSFAAALFLAARIFGATAVIFTAAAVVFATAAVSAAALVQQTLCPGNDLVTVGSNHINSACDSGQCGENF